MHTLIVSRMGALGMESAADLARAMPSAPSLVAIRAWMRGDARPDPKWWGPLAEALGVSVAQLSEIDRQARLADATGGGL